jgi:hypothetical protein
VREVIVFATELALPGVAVHDARAIQWELFIFADVRDVLAGPRPQTVVVIHGGTAQPDAWRAALREAGVLPAPAEPGDRG